MFRPSEITLNCPHCGFSYQAPVFSIVDVGETPELKQLLLTGRLNASQCPNCRNINYLATPLLYHDPEHEFLAVFMPAQLNMTEVQRQKAIGDLTKALMDALPPEKRRGYMLSPQQFLSMDSLGEKILGLDGVTPEMIEASKRKAQLVEELARIQDDSMAFNMVVAENKELLDQEFFMMLSNAIGTAESVGDSTQTERLSQLQEKLLPLTEVGQRMLKQRRAIEKLGERPTRDAIMRAILDGDLDEVEAITFVAYSALDYEFFQALTEHIEAASDEERELLEEKRQRMLKIIEQIRASEEQRLQAASAIIQELLSAEDMDKTLDQLLPYIDQTVLLLLAVNISQAEESGATAAAARLRQLSNAINKRMHDAMPPQLVLILQLAEADYPDEVRAILKQHQDIVNDDFIAAIEAYIAEMESGDMTDKDRQQLARHFHNILTLIRLGG
ncbi:MAG TPA: hypothetical protein G4N94_11750 [Caldilineae bacterium]|nr:hypothetical protein [Caldilineae bacterium]